MANNRYDLEIVIRTKKEGPDPVPPPGSGLKWTELSSAVNLAQQVFQTAGQAAQFAYDNIKEGAQLELAQSRFENLAGSINTTADSLLTKMRAATKGMQSDAELIAGATDIINLGLAKTEEDTVRLATAVGTLGLDMQQVVLTFANNSKARLDALGLSVEDVTKKAAELEAQGFKGDAFDEAVLIGLEEKMTLLGDASETTAGQLQILESDWKNLVNSWKEGAAELAGPVISETVRARDEVESLRQAYEKGLITNTQYASAQNDVKIRSQSAAEALEQYGLVVDSMGDVHDPAILAAERLEERLEELGVETENLTEAQITQAARSAEMSAFYQAQAAAADGLSASQLALYEHLKLTAEGAGELSGAQSMLYGEMETATNTTYAWKGANDSAGASVEEHSNKAQGLLERIAALEGQTTHTVDLRVLGLDDLARAQQLIQNASGFNANDQPDPYAVQGDRDFGDEYDQSGRFDGGNTTQVNNFNINESVNPDATAQAVAEKVGGLR